MLRPTRSTLSRLAARQTQAAEHLDTGLLQAFREQKVTAKERSAVMSHLAQCPSCRKVVSLLAPSREREPSAAPSETGPRIAWSKLRWAAAALASLCLLLVFRSERNPTSSERQNVTTPASQVILADRPSSSLTPDVIPKEGKALKVAPKLQAPVRTRLTKPVSPPPAIAIEHSLDASAVKELDLYDRASALQLKKLSVAEVQKLAQANVSGGAETAVARETALRAAKEPARASVAAPQVLKSGNPIPQNGLYSFAPRSVPLRSLAAKVLVAPPAAARWSLTRSNDAENETPGILYRSQDEGRTWTPFTVAPGIPLTALATQGSEVWVGGKDGALYHSSDNGDHWVAVAVSDAGESLTSLITRIEMPGAGRIVIKDRSGRNWVSNDNGQHWAAR